MLHCTRSNMNYNSGFANIDDTQHLVCLQDIVFKTLLAVGTQHTFVTYILGKTLCSSKVSYSKSTFPVKLHLTCYDFS